jgi:CubicO group peptidase (beta-lactamase class C family)
MILVDEGVLRLDAAVDQWLPELADRRVLRSLDAELDDTVPADRPITVDDLLTFRLGFGTMMVAPGTYPIQRAEAELRLMTLGPPWPPTPHTPDEWIAAFGTLPLMHQPGERWLYNTGSQVLGILVERVAGEPLEDVMRDRLFEPLGMTDTAFSVSPDRLDRFTAAYAVTSSTGELKVLDGIEGSYWSEPPALPSAAGWLVSTIDDFWAFVQLLLGKGAFGGRRILSEASVAAMLTDHLSAEQRAGNEILLGPDGGWGYGLRVPAAGAPSAPPDRGGYGYGWDGGTGTTWRTDPDNDLTCILFTQRAMTSPAPPEVFTDFWRCAYDSLVD